MSNINFYLAIMGIAGGIMCAVADLFLDLKGPENEKIGKMKIIDSMWDHMPHYRFVVSTVLAMFAVPMYSCGMIALVNIISGRAPSFAMVLKAIFLVGAMGGFMIHTYLNLCPTIYKIIKKESGLELADKVICATFKQISVPFFVCYSMLVIIPSGMVIYSICARLLQVPMYCIFFNPVVFQAVGLLLRATKLKCFIDAPSCCAASLGLASFGMIALYVV